MDCGSFCISWILSQNNQKYEESDFIFSETFLGGSLLPKIWIILLSSFDKVEIVHEYEEIFININEEETPLLSEYKHRLNEFKNKWGMCSNNNITISYLREKLEKYYCIIPIKKGEWSHLVILKKIDNGNIFLADNKKRDFTVSENEFEDLINLYNWKYALFIKR